MTTPAEDARRRQLLTTLRDKRRQNWCFEQDDAADLIDSLAAQIDAERAKSERLRAALYDYGCHRTGCGLVLHRTECTCGLRTALSSP